MLCASLIQCKDLFTRSQNLNRTLTRWLMCKRVNNVVIHVLLSLIGKFSQASPTKLFLSAKEKANRNIKNLLKLSLPGRVSFWLRLNKWPSRFTMTSGRPQRFQPPQSLKSKSRNLKSLKMLESGRENAISTEIWLRWVYRCVKRSISGNEDINSQY